VNGEAVLIRKSLSNALSRVFNHLESKSREPRYVWADAICIDQSNDVEKAAQVAIMCEIYQKSHQVIVYLGEPPFWNFGVAEKALAAWGKNSRLFGDSRYDGFGFQKTLKQVHYQQQPLVDSPQLALFF
jgi:Heterokaryon incompatibility protein (HET)